MLSPIARLVRIASVVVCLIVIASFAIFAVDQTEGASAHQQQVLNGETTDGPAVPAATGSPRSAPPHPGTVHRVIDEASNTVTSPFAGITAGSSSEWTVHGVNLLLTLIVYGVGVGFLVRMFRLGV